MDRKIALNKVLNDIVNSPDIDSEVYLTYKPLYDIFQKFGYRCNCDMSMRHVIKNDMSLGEKKKIYPEIECLLCTFADHHGREVIYSLLTVAAVFKKHTAQLIINEIRDNINLSEEEQRENFKSYCWHLCDHLYELGVKTFKDDYVELIKNKELGHDRQMLLLLLGKIRAYDCTDILLSCLADDEINGHALSALYKLKYSDGSYHKSFLTDSRSWVRKIGEKIEALDLNNR